MAFVFSYNLLQIIKLRLYILRSLAHIMPLIKMEFCTQFVIGCWFLFVQKLNFLIQSGS